MAIDTYDHLKLPEELMVEIFLRSSVESLLRAKCVCKLWYSLIKRPNFAVNHVEYQKSHNKGRLFLQYFKEKYLSYALFDDETLVSDIYHDLDHLEQFPYGLLMEGPINGLFCLFDGIDRIVLWNPALKELRTLPLPHPHFLPHVIVFTGVIGFGIDPLTHDYKLVLIRVFWDEILDDLYPDIYVTVYDLSSNTWRLLDDGDFDLRHVSAVNLSSTFLNGTYYWLDSVDVVIAFDMWNEKFRKLPGPDISYTTPFPRRRLTLYNDKVALLRTKPFCIDIWVMLEEGVWFKKFSFTSLPKRINVLGFWKNDVLIFTTGCSETEKDYQPVLYTANTHEMRNLGPIGNSQFFKSSIFYESLVSLECAMGHKERCTSLSHFLRRRSKSIFVHETTIDKLVSS